jgi:hypothetical protein
MRVMQVTIYEMVDVICVRDRFVTATRGVFVLFIVRAALMAIFTRSGIFRAGFERVLVDVVLVNVVKVAVVKVIDVIVML